MAPFWVKICWGLLRVCFSERSIAGISEKPDTGDTLQDIHVILIFTVVISKKKKKIEVKGLELSWCMICNDSYPPFSFEMYR